MPVSHYGFAQKVAIARRVDVILALSHGWLYGTHKRISAGIVLHALRQLTRT